MPHLIDFLDAAIYLLPVIALALTLPILTLRAIH